jgi:hypothetical protein
MEPIKNVKIIVHTICWNSINRSVPVISYFRAYYGIETISDVYVLNPLIRSTAIRYGKNYLAYEQSK